MLLAIALIMVEKISGYTATLSIVFMQYLQDYRKLGYVNYSKNVSRHRKYHRSM
jgi:hypothetical protein